MIATLPAAAERPPKLSPSNFAVSYALVFFVSLGILTIGISGDGFYKIDEGLYTGAARNFLAAGPSMVREHPPLAKYLIALSIKFFGDRPLGWRFPSALAGAAVALSAFGLTLQLARSLHSAYIAWLLIVTNGFWFFMSRIANLSIIELAFEIAAVWAFLIAINETLNGGNARINLPTERSLAKTHSTRSLPWFPLSGVLFGLSIATRWCGVVGLAVCVGYALVYYRSQLGNLVRMCVSAVAVYLIAWIPLLLREHWSATYLIPANLYILHFHRNATTDPRPGEPWWTWMFKLDLQQAPMELIANPVICILGLAAVAFLFWRRKPLLPALYVAHILQWAIVPNHWAHYYYYLEAFTWLTLTLAVAMQGLKIRGIRLDTVIAACALGAVAWPFWTAIR